MTARVDPNLLIELKRYGAKEAEKCINCGNCTAICSLTSETDRFPRQIIRYAQLGLGKELLGSKELWLCYNCGQCSETCPQQAEPANLMSAARSYAISHYAPFKTGVLFGKYPLVGGIMALLLTLFFGLFLYSERQVMATDQLKLFGFLSRDLIHNVGLAVMVLLAIICLITIFTMCVRIFRVNNISWKNFWQSMKKKGGKALWQSIIVEALAQKRYRKECESKNDYKTWLLSKWFVHAATMWGFLGLLLATALNFLLDILQIKATGTYVPLWYPTRLIGTLSGILFIYGVTVLLYKRLWLVDKAHSYSQPSDWIFLILLFLSGISGFVIEIAIYLPWTPLWAYWTFIFHVSISIVLLLLIPFTKFSHAIYRTLALVMQALQPEAE